LGDKGNFDTAEESADLALDEFGRLDIWVKQWASKP
jgi:hypothetical protein